MDCLFLTYLGTKFSNCLQLKVINKALFNPHRLHKTTIICIYSLKGPRPNQQQKTEFYKLYLNM